MYASFLVLGFSDFYLLGTGVNRPETEAEADAVNEVDTVKVLHISPWWGSFDPPVNFYGSP